MSQKQEQFDLPVITDTYTACSIAEGFDGEDHSNADIIGAWACLIKSGACWTLQGWYGRRAMDFINNGLITREGVVTEKGLAYAQE